MSVLKLAKKGAHDQCFLPLVAVKNGFLKQDFVPELAKLTRLH
jgi:hypothetical protein